MRSIRVCAGSALWITRHPERASAVVAAERERVCPGDGFNARKRGKFRQQLIEEAPLRIGFRILRARNHLIEHEEAVRVKPEIGRAQVEEALDEQSRAGQQQQRERDLRDDERRTHALRMRTAGRSFRALLQRVGHVRPRDLQRRHEPEQQRAHDRDHGSEHADADVDVDVGETRDIARPKRAQQIHAPPREQQARPLHRAARGRNSPRAIAARCSCGSRRAQCGCRSRDCAPPRARAADWPRSRRRSAARARPRLTRSTTPAAHRRRCPPAAARARLSDPCSYRDIAARRRCAIGRNSASAPAFVTPGFIRPTSRRKYEPRCVTFDATSGSSALMYSLLATLTGNFHPGGITPMTVCVRPDIVISRPMMFLSLANARCHRP